MLILATCQANLDQLNSIQCNFHEFLNGKLSVIISSNSVSEVAFLLHHRKIFMIPQVLLLSQATKNIPYSSSELTISSIMEARLRPRKFGFIISFSRYSFILNTIVFHYLSVREFVACHFSTYVSISGIHGKRPLCTSSVIFASPWPCVIMILCSSMQSSAQ